eukprot:2188437-Rhodomonas_salina.1
MSQLTEAMNKFLREGSSDEEKLIRARVVMWMGAVHLNAFVSSNWTGPELKVHFSPFPSHASVEPGTDISKSLQKARSAPLLLCRNLGIGFRVSGSVVSDTESLDDKRHDTDLSMWSQCPGHGGGQ